MLPPRGMSARVSPAPGSPMSSGGCDHSIPLACEGSRTHRNQVAHVLTDLFWRQVQRGCCPSRCDPSSCAEHHLSQELRCLGHDAARLSASEPLSDKVMHAERYCQSVSRPNSWSRWVIAMADTLQYERATKMRSTLADRICWLSTAVLGMRKLAAKALASASRSLEVLGSISTSLCSTR